MGNISQRFVEHLMFLQESVLPTAVFSKSGNCFLDYLAVTAAGCVNTQDKINNYIRSNAIGGSNHIIGKEMTVDMRNSCLINAFNAHVLELDDSHRQAMTHLGAPIFSSLLSVAEVNNLTIGKILISAVVGYEAAVRLANAIQPYHKKRGFHVSGTCCTVGAAMAIASLLDYTEEEFANTLSAAATSAAGLLGVAAGKSEQKPYNIAHAAVSGLDAALFGRFFCGSEDILGDSRGFFCAMTDFVNIDKLFEPGYAIETIYQKTYASCRHCHAPLEAMLIIREKNNFNVDEVKSILVQTYDLAINGHNHTTISGVSSAKQSIPYNVAAACVFRDCGMSAFAPEKVNDESVLRLISKVEVLDDPELTKLVPHKRAATVTVTLDDGRVFRERVDYAKGEPEHPITDSEMEEKFLSLTEYAGHKKEAAKKVISYIRNDITSSIDSLLKCMQ